MTADATFKKIEAIFQDVFKIPGFQLSPQTRAKDVKGWDSISHVRFIVAVEKGFKIRFKSQHIASWKNIGDMHKDVVQALKV